MNELNEEKDGGSPAYYAVMSGIPAGLLLGIGSRYLLHRVGDNEIYQKEAAGTLAALQWVQYFGFALAAVALLVLVINLVKNPRP